MAGGFRQFNPHPIDIDSTFLSGAEIYEHERLFQGSASNRRVAGGKDNDA